MFNAARMCVGIALRRSCANVTGTTSVRAALVATGNANVTFTRGVADYTREKPHMNIGTIGHVDHGKVLLYSNGRVHPSLCCRKMYLSDDSYIFYIQNGNLGASISISISIYLSIKLSNYLTNDLDR